MRLGFTMFSEKPPWQKYYGLFCSNWGITTNSKDLGRSSAQKKGLNPHVPSLFPSLFHHGPFIFHHYPSIFPHVPSCSQHFPSFSQHFPSIFPAFSIVFPSFSNLFPALRPPREAQAQHHACHGPPRTAAALMGRGFAGPLQGQVGHLHPVIVDLCVLNVWWIWKKIKLIVVFVSLWCM